MTMATPLGRRLGPGLGMPRRPNASGSGAIVVPEPGTANVLRYGAGGDGGRTDDGDYRLVVGVDIPAATRAIRVAMWGANGGHAGSGGSAGGAGGFTGGDLAVREGDVIDLIVGGAGVPGGTATGFGVRRSNAGAGGPASWGGTTLRAHGGGFTGLVINGVVALVAGGGGAGGPVSSRRGGAGGGLIGQSGEGSGGAGGGQSPSALTSQLRGGWLRGGGASASGSDVPGGGGWFGGDGGANWGGGGGSGYAAPFAANVIQETGDYGTAGGTSHPDYSAAVLSQGGRIVIRY